MFLHSLLIALQVDWTVVAEKSGFSNAKTAVTRFAQIKKKLGWEGDASSAAAASKPAKKSDKTARSMKMNSLSGSGTNVNPSKVTKRGTKPKANAGPKPEAEREEDKETVKGEAKKATEKIHEDITDYAEEQFDNLLHTGGYQGRRVDQYQEEYEEA